MALSTRIFGKTGVDRAYFRKTALWDSRRQKLMDTRYRGRGSVDG